jgi:putative intracellular protease/amidase
MESLHFGVLFEKVANRHRLVIMSKLHRFIFFISALFLGTQLLAAKPILIVVTNHEAMGNTEQATGYFLSEVAHPWHVFTEAGYAVEFASPLGGFAPMDPKSFDLDDPINRKFWETLDAVQGLVSTQPLAELSADGYAAIFLAGGHGTMWDFPNSEVLAEAVATHYESDGVVAAVCHGPAGLVNVNLSDGTPLIAGKRVAGFTNSEEAAVNLTEVMPFLLQDALSAKGASFVVGDNFQPNVVVSERLVTGQNPASATGTAEAVVKLLE